MTTLQGDFAMPIILWGSTGFTSNTGEGKFLCPQCGDERRYERKEVNRWFTLYFIPLFPIGSAGEYVECTKCEGSWEVGILEITGRDRERR
jgi:hypothetical protein